MNTTGQPPEDSVAHDSPAVQAHLTITQAVIQRMASNSASCKAWCIALVSAMLVIVGNKGQPVLALLAFIPTVVFLVLDAYYLALERCFRMSYNTFVNKLTGGHLKPEDVYMVSPEGSVWKELIRALGSFSIWPFYTMLALMIVLAKVLIV